MKTNAKKRDRFSNRIGRLFRRIDNTRRPGMGIQWVVQDDGNLATFYVYDWVTNVQTGKSGRLSGAQWVVEYQYSDEGIVRQVFRAMMAFEEHELREHFLFKGKRVMDPHKRGTFA